MKRIVVLLVLIAAAAGGWFFWRSHQRKADQELVLYGNVDIREVNLGFRVSGKVSKLMVDEGDPVKAGQLIATLDPEPNRREVQEAEAQAASQKARLAMMEAGYRKEDIDQAQANVHEGEATLANAERTLTRKQELAEHKVGPVQDYDDALGARDEARARLNAYRAALSLQEAGYRPEEIAQALADLAKAEASLAAAQLRLSDTELRAPSNGVIMTRAVEPGTIIQPGAIVFTVSLTDPVWARVYVAEQRLGDVHPGMKMLVYTDSRPDKPYPGVIGYISPQAEFTPKTVETPELRTALVYRLRVIIPNPGEDLRQGMPVTVRPAPDK
jgi:HlyD family secretion protein